jgi:hypothetical protein
MQRKTEGQRDGTKETETEYHRHLDGRSALTPPRSSMSTALSTRARKSLRTKLPGLSPLANCTDRATAVLLGIEGATWSA